MLFDTNPSKIRDHDQILVDSATGFSLRALKVSKQALDIIRFVSEYVRHRSYPKYCGINAESHLTRQRGESRSWGASEPSAVD